MREVPPYCLVFFYRLSVLLILIIPAVFSTWPPSGDVSGVAGYHPQILQSTVPSCAWWSSAAPACAPFSPVSIESFHPRFQLAPLSGSGLRKDAPVQFRSNPPPLVLVTPGCCLFFWGSSYLSLEKGTLHFGFMSCFSPTSSPLKDPLLK